MNHASRPLGIGTLLCLVVLLSGCAAGSPAIVAPTQEGVVAQAPEIPTPAPEATHTPEPTVAPQPTVAAVQSESATTADLTVDENETAGASAPEGGVALAVSDSPEVAGSATSDSAAFAQEVPLTTDSPATGDGTEVQPPAAAPVEGAVAAAPVDTDAVAAAPAAQPVQTPRPAPPPDPGTGLSQMISGGANGRLEVALTFDAGADTGYGMEILDLLRDEGIKATFGMTGVYAESNPDIVRRMVAEGHQLMNHTWDHPSLTGANTGMPPLTPDQVADQLWSTENLVSEITGGYQMLPYFRPPYGDYDAASLGYLYNNGYYLSIWWTCDSHGWAGWGAQEIIDYCSANLVEDEILLLHVGAAAAGDFEALPGLIQSFRDKGYAFVTVEQMLQP